MKEEKFHAADYTASEVEAAKRVMIEVAQNLGEYADACVVVGGWVPELLLPNAEPKHTGSIDVDLALNPERLSGERYASLLDALKRKGYQPGEKPFQLFKEVKVGKEMVRVPIMRGERFFHNHRRFLPPERIFHSVLTSNSTMLYSWLLPHRDLRMKIHKNGHWKALLVVLGLSQGTGLPAESISYNQHIRPLLSDNCFYCHGPDENHRKGKLRLDIREEAIKKAIIPGKPDESELIKRIHTTDPDDQMPPPESNKILTSAQKEMLKQWISEGAKYEGHWAYVSPRKPAIPAGKNPIDYLVRQRLEKVGLQPSPEADKRTLLRRLHFDLTGLPPKPEEAEAFEGNTSSSAYSELVEKLLASPHFGERMAIGWLDVVRFADTIGYHSDNPRNVWPYRDYVIRAFNENKRFDQFTREQIAGDLMPGAGLEQKVGSAFNRLLLSTEEGGAQPKDYEARMLTDRVRAVGAVWMGQTIGCAQCHDHKFDPIKMKDFYAMGAFFSDIKEPILGRREDGMLVPTDAQAAELKRLDDQMRKAQADYDKEHPELESAFAAWKSDQIEQLSQNKRWQILRFSKLNSTGGSKLRKQGDDSILVQDKNPEKDSYTLVTTNLTGDLAGLRIEALPHESLPSKGPGRSSNGNFVLTEVIATIQRNDGSTQTVEFASARATTEQTGGEANPYKVWSAASTIDHDVKGERWGWAILPHAGTSQQIVLGFSNTLAVASGEVLTIELHQKHGNGGHNLGHFRVSMTSDPGAVSGPFVFPPAGELAELLALDAAKLSDAQKEKLWSIYKKNAPELEGLRKEIAASTKARNEYEATLPRCLVSISSDKPRTVRILPRGNFLIETGDIVEPALPSYLVPRNSDKPRLTRLDLAEWLISKENPLTARVVVNRFWKQFFGVGLAKVLDDFGAQGIPPGNQALLDWLAAEFMESGWDMKHMVRLIVTSAVYKQSSVASAVARAKDPDNREFSAQGRWRLDAELVRDNALAIAGLLSTKIGGPSVKPYQPDGYWENLNFPRRNWDASNGPDQYRRGLYTWWQRSFLHPSMLAFDAPSREECVAERNRSNIPQQALVLLNDPTYVEASRSFAARIVREGGSDNEARLRWAWRTALVRLPRTDEIETAQELLKKQISEYRADTKAAEELTKVGLLDRPAGIDPAELAAWTNLARVILNLHETVTRS